MSKIVVEETVLRQALAMLEHIDNRNNDSDFLQPNECEQLGAAIVALWETLAQTQPEPPPEAKTKDEQIAYCAGWWAALESVAPEKKKQDSSGWVCPKCNTDRTKAACPRGHHAALTGECPMIGTAHSRPAYYDSEGGSMCNGIGRDYF